MTLMEGHYCAACTGQFNVPHHSQCDYREDYIVKDSGSRESFDSGMVRDTEEGKIDYTRVLAGPMFERWAIHLQKAAESKYEDVRPGMANWELADGEAEYHRFRKSALRHLLQWLRGETDEDHAAAVMFNLNGSEYVKEKMVK